MFGLSMLLYGSFEKLFKVKRPIVGAVICMLGFLLCFSVQYGAIGIYRAALIELPTAWYTSPYLFWLGLPQRSFFSADYYPLLPWTLLFFAGAFSGAYAKLLPRGPISQRLAPLAFIGRHTMLIYLVHQPVFYGIFFLVELF